MKQKFKNFRNQISQFVSILLIAILFSSCSENTNLKEQNSTGNELSFNVEDFKKFREEKSTSKITDSVKYNSTKSPGIRSGIINAVSHAEVNINDLNKFFPNHLPDLQVIAITTVNDIDSHEESGLFLHAVDDDNRMHLLAYEKKSNSKKYKLIDFPVSYINGYKLDNLLFVTQNLFPSHNLNTVAVSNIDQYSGNGYDDIKLLAFAIKYDLPSVKKYGLIPFSGSKSKLAHAYIDNKPCSMAAHQCRNGSDIATECHPSGGGCRTPTCQRQAIVYAYSYNSRYDELNDFNSFLPSSDMYTFRNEVFATPTGEFWFDAYYATSSHFAETINFTLLTKITLQTPVISEGMYAYLGDNTNYFLTGTKYDGVVDMIQYSADRSFSSLYKNLIVDIQDRTVSFRNENIADIKTQLSNPKYN
jgi:hypothetical protein